eukprot:GFKZ01007870.1.p1 GENE.GFKZ01007870.1~~GFKZ01007870.1.p1  ORF type:complete len:762 (-),score=104.81 GFKZ01007870.1:1335-3620(-)
METAFALPFSLQPCISPFYPNWPCQLCRRRKSTRRHQLIISCRKSNPDSQNAGSSQSQRFEADSKRQANDMSDIFDDHREIEGLPRLRATPAEQTGHRGWREGKGGEEDDNYWTDVRVREVLFRKGSSVSEDDFNLAERPLDRHGKPATYSAAVHYDEKSGKWVPTSEEEERRLKQPHPIYDPFYVKEAEEGESFTSLRPKWSTESEASEQQDSHSAYVHGGFEFTERPLVDDMSHHRRRQLGMPRGGWRVVHLGTSSAIPTSKRNVSSTAMLVKSMQEGEKEPDMFLVDAGENTDDRLIDCEWCMTHGFRWIRAIFITHLHGDHIYGLPMLLASIGKYAQHRRRKAIENGYDGSDPVVRVFGPYGTRGFIRASLYWTNPIGVRFSVSELVPREDDFLHLRYNEQEMSSAGEIFVHEYGSDEIQVGGGVDLKREAPPPHPEEERAEDITAGDDGLWRVWEQQDGTRRLEVVAAPLRHRLPCFGYVFRESVVGRGSSHENGKGTGSSTGAGNGATHGKASNGVAYEINKEKAKELGVHGTQLRVLRSGRSITVSKTGLVVRPEDVASSDSRTDEDYEGDKAPSSRYERKVTILGDTSNSSAIADAAMDSDLLVHEATFSNNLRVKARVSMHSTAGMAGAFGGRIRARKLALTHFSSRYEMMHAESRFKQSHGSNTEGADDENVDNNDEDERMIEGSATDDDDFDNPNQLVREALVGYGVPSANIVAAYDFLEHDIQPAATTGAENSKPSATSESFAVQTSHD